MPGKAMRRVVATLVAGLVVATATPAEAAGPRLAYTSGCCVASGTLTIHKPGGAHRVVARTPNSIVGDPSWSPDASRVAYATWSLGQGLVRVARADGSKDALLASLPGFYVGDVVWSPAGGWIALGAWSQTGFVWGFPSAPQIFLAQVKGSLLVPVGPGAQPTWSPDGSRLAFTQADAIYVVDIADPSAPRRVSPVGVVASDPAWGPGGKKLAFLAEKVPALAYQRRIWVVRSDGTGARRLPVAAAEAPSFSPDGKSLAYTWTSKIGQGGLYTVGLGGKKVRRIANDAYGSPAWSPGGGRIAYRVSGPACCDGELWLVRPDGSARQRVAITDGRPDMAWSR